jgi:periplasmic glucans biosynthesis protein
VAVSTRTGSARVIGVPDDKQPLPRSARKFVIDFVPPALPQTADGVEAVVTVSSGAVHNVHVESYPAIRGYRAVFDYVPEPGKAVEMRCFLKRGEGEALSETWTYSMPPPPEEKRS